MKAKKRSLVKKVLNKEFFDFNLDNSGVLNKSEHWIVDLKNCLINQARDEGVVLKENQIKVVWNNSFMEYIMYIDGVFCGYVDPSGNK